MKYGILKPGLNTGSDDEIQCGFVAPLSVISNQPSYAQDTMNLTRKASSQNVQRWEIEANLEPTNNSANFMLHSIENGHDGIFHVRMPQIANLGAADLTDALTHLSAVAKAYIVTLSGEYDLIPGEYIQFENHSKVYIVTAFTKAGTTTVSVRPRLHKAVPAGTAVRNGGNVTMHARYDSSVRLGITYIDGVLSDPGSVKLIEAL